MSTYLTVLFPFSTSQKEESLLTENESMIIAEDPDTMRLYYAYIPEEYAQPGEALDAADARPVSELSMELQLQIVSHREEMTPAYLAFLREGMVVQS